VTEDSHDEDGCRRLGDVSSSPADRCARLEAVGDDRPSPEGLWPAPSSAVLHQSRAQPAAPSAAARVASCSRLPGRGGFAGAHDPETAQTPQEESTVAANDGRSALSDCRAGPTVTRENRRGGANWTPELLRSAPNPATWIGCRPRPNAWMATGSFRSPELAVWLSRSPGLPGFAIRCALVVFHLTHIIEMRQG
jgi:hypothetical protein